MASLFSAGIQLELPGSGDYTNTWDIVANRNFAKLDSKLSGVTSLNLSLGNGAVSTSTTAVSNSDVLVLRLTGTLTANRTVTLPANFKGSYLVCNETTMGSFTITFASAGLTGAVVTKDSGTKFVLFSTGSALITFEGVKSNSALVGEIRMYRGPITDETALNALGWYLCNGQTVAGYGTTVDLRDRFVRGETSLASTPNAVAAQTGNTGSSALSISGTTQAHELSVSEIPAHTHLTIANTVVTSPDLNTNASLSVARYFNSEGNNEQYRLKGTSTTPTLGPTSSVGQGNGHTHSISLTGVGAHTHSTSALMPAHVRIAFIEYTGVVT